MGGIIHNTYVIVSLFIVYFLAVEDIRIKFLGGNANRLDGKYIIVVKKVKKFLIFSIND